MKVDEDVLAGCDLKAAVAQAQELDRFPPLATDRSLAETEDEVASQVEAAFFTGQRIHAETLTMLRAGVGAFGPRPATLTPLPARVLYTALVASLGERMPASSRSMENWKDHTAFGTPASESAAEYLVEFDIASCYEYIDHKWLREELLTRTMKVGQCVAVTELLSEVFGRPLGLPQMTGASDLLADTYK